MPLRLFRPRPRTVYGHALAEPRLTATGAALALLYLGGPAIAFVLACDLVVWAIGRIAFDACLAVWCLF